MSAGRSYGALRGSLWSAPDFAALSDSAIVAYLYLFSHQLGNQAGMFRLPAQYLACDRRWDVEKAERVFAELETAGWVARSGDWVALTRMMEHDPPPNCKAAIGAARAVLSGLEMAPGLDVRPMLKALQGLARRFQDEVLTHAVATIEERLGDGMDTVSVPYANDEDTVSHHNHHQDQLPDDHGDHIPRGANDCIVTAVTPSVPAQAEIARLSPDLKALDTPERREAYKASPIGKTYSDYLIQIYFGRDGHKPGREANA